VARSRRDWHDIMADILEVTDKEGGVNKTRIVYRANLNFRRLEGYMEDLTESNLLRENSIGGDALFETTEKGREFLSHYRKIRTFI
jgi:predicted transcriptional regulator